MASKGYVVNFDAFALSTSAKTAILLIAGAAEHIAALVELGVSIDSTATCLVELVVSTGAGAGTVGSSPTPTQIRGFVAAGATNPAQVTAGIEYSAEPTVLSRLKAWRFAGPGPLVIQSPLGREAQSLLSSSSAYEALGLRLTASTGTPNADGYMEFEV
jgi:hypothetical protein